MARKTSIKKQVATYLGIDEKELNFTIDIIGDIALLKTPVWIRKETCDIELYRKIAEYLITKFSYIKSIWMTYSPVKGEHRTRELLYLAGENRTTTYYKEHGCIFKIDISNTYISPRLSYEHLRIAKLVEKNEVIINMFAGAGGFSIVIAKHSHAKQIHSIDINPIAYELMLENIKINKVSDKVIAYLGDARNVINTKLRGTADRVLLPLPNIDISFYKAALSSLRRDRGYLHIYDFVPFQTDKETTLKKAFEKISKIITSLSWKPYLDNTRIVRSIGPKQVQVVLDVFVKRHNYQIDDA